MKTKPKPTAILVDPKKHPSLKGRPLPHSFEPDELDNFKPTASLPTALQRSKKRPKTAPKQPKRVKTRSTHPDPTKTGWIAFEDEKPKKGQVIAFGRFDKHGQFIMRQGLYDFAERDYFYSHWLALPNLPERKCK